MADRPVIKTVPSGAVFDTDTLNENFTKLRDSFDDLVSRRGTAAANNSLVGDLDLAGNGLRNTAVISPIGGPTETVGTIEQLRISETPEGTTVQVLGYHTSGDGGGGIFYLDAADTTSPDNGGSVIVDASNNRWKRRDRETIANPKCWGAFGDGTTVDKDALLSTVQTGLTHLVSSNYYLDDIVSVSNTRLDIRGDGGTLVTDQKTSMVGCNATSLQGRTDAAFSQIINVGFDQPYFGGTGTENNHSVAGFSGQSPLVALSYGAVDIAPSFGYGPNTAPRNAWGGVMLGNRHIVYTMGFQFFTGYVSVAGNTLIGDGSPTGSTRANSPGYRYTGYNTFGIDPNIGAVSAANVSKDIRNALAIQNTASYGNHVGFHGTNAEVGVHFTEVDTNDDAVQRHNTVSATFKDAERAVYIRGAEYNIVEVNASGSTEWAIDVGPSGTGQYGTGRHNWLRGIIRDASGTRGVSVTSTDARLDLSIIDSSAGLTVSGARATGRVKVDGVPGRGAIISSSGHHLDITTLNCSGDFDIVVFGNDSVFNLNCAGNVSVSGSNNVITGRIAGNVSCTGSGNKFVGIINGSITGRGNNDFSGVKGERYRARVNVTTDASGDFTVTTNLSTTTQNATATIISALSGNVYGYCVPKSVTAGSVTFRAFDTTGAAIASTDLTLMVEAERHA